MINKNTLWRLDLTTFSVTRRKDSYNKVAQLQSIFCLKARYWIESFHPISDTIATHLSYWFRESFEMTPLLCRLLLPLPNYSLQAKLAKMSSLTPELDTFFLCSPVFVFCFCRTALFTDSVMLIMPVIISAGRRTNPLYCTWHSVMYIPRTLSQKNFATQASGASLEMRQPKWTMLLAWSWRRLTMLASETTH